MKINALLKTALLCLLIGCSHGSVPQYTYRNGQVSFLNQGEEGTIVLRANGNGKDLQTASLNGQQSAFYILLFKGVPGSSVASSPMIPDENAAYQQHGDYLNNLIEKGNYQTFMMSSNLVSNPTTYKGVTNIAVDVKINYASLRKDLEQNNVIRKFGY